MRCCTWGNSAFAASTLFRQLPGSRTPTMKHCLTICSKSRSLPPKVITTRSVSRPTESICGRRDDAHSDTATEPPTRRTLSSGDCGRQKGPS